MFKEFKENIMKMIWRVEISIKKIFLKNHMEKSGVEKFHSKEKH